MERQNSVVTPEVKIEIDVAEDESLLWGALNTCTGKPSGVNSCVGLSNLVSCHLKKKKICSRLIYLSVSVCVISFYIVSLSLFLCVCLSFSYSLSHLPARLMYLPLDYAL